MKVLLALAALIIFTTADSAQTAGTKTDTQWWNDVQFVIPIQKTKDKKGNDVDKVVLNLNGIARVGRNVSYPVDTRFSATLDFRVNKYIKISPGYLYQRFEQFKNQRNYESRLTIAANVEKKLSSLVTFRHRSMFEYKFRNFRPNTLVYRSRFQFNYSVRRNDKELFSPFVSIEPHYDFKLNALNREEIFAGISRRVSRKASLEVFYLRLQAKPVNANGIGTNLRIKLW